MVAPAKLLQQLLALDEPQRLEIAHVLLESADAWVDLKMSDDERERLNAAGDRRSQRRATGWFRRETRAGRESCRSSLLLGCPVGA
jgi:hypothetical protein